MSHWLDESDNEPSAKITDGVHDCEIVKVRAERDGQPWMSTNGFPQLQVVYQDANGRELPEYLILTEKAAWKLRRLITHCNPPLNTERLRQAEQEYGKEGKGFIWFHDQEFAEKKLIGRKVRIQVKNGDVLDHVRVEYDPPGAEVGGKSEPRPLEKAAEPAKPQGRPEPAELKGKQAKVMAVAELTARLGHEPTEKEREIFRTARLAMMNEKMVDESDLTQHHYKAIVEDAYTKITKARPEADDDLPF